MSDGAPRVSAVVTTLNYAGFIAGALESVLGQSRPPDEIVVIDDGSTDETAAVVARFADRGVRYVWQANAGAGGARNRGIRETTGELIGFLDADDQWLPDKLERQIAWLAEHPDAALVSGSMIWWDTRRDTRRLERFGVPKGRDVNRELLVRNVVGNPSMALIRRSALDRAGIFDPALRWGQDWELFIRLSRVGALGWLDEPVIVYRWHGESLSNQRRWERAAVLEGISARAIASWAAWPDRLALRARARSTRWFELADLCKHEPDRRFARIGFAGGAFVVWPFERTLDKGIMLLRAIAGERRFRALRRRT